MLQKIKYKLRIAFRQLQYRLIYSSAQRKILREKFVLTDFKKIPIFIISFNRLSYVKTTIEWLEKFGYYNIHIIDNASTYPPLLDYLKKVQYTVHYMDENLGYKVFWKSEAFKEYRKDFYAVTDPDLLPIEDCPDNFMEIFYNNLKKFPFIKKCGFSLKIDDIPKDSIFKNDIVKWESQFQHSYIKKSNIFYAEIDTTFALYMPDCISESTPFLRAIRTGYPYQVRHLPWYRKSIDTDTEEDIYYSQHKTNGWWDVVKGELTPDGKEIDLNRK